MGLMHRFRQLAAGRREVGAPEPEPQEPAPEVAGLDFMRAIAAHRAWQERLEAALEGRQPMPAPGEAANETACVLGQWIHGPGGDDFGNLDSFADLRREHALFHRHVGRALAEIQSGRRERATELLERDCRRSSERLKMLLAKLYVQLQDER